MQWPTRHIRAIKPQDLDPYLGIKSKFKDVPSLKISSNTTNNFSKSGVATCSIHETCNVKISITLRFHAHVCTHTLNAAYFDFFLCHPSQVYIHITGNNSLQSIDWRNTENVFQLIRNPAGAGKKSSYRSRPRFQHRFTAAWSGPSGVPRRGVVWLYR